MKKDDKFCLTCKCQPNCKSIKLVSEFLTKIRNSLLLRNLDIISEEYSKNESNKGFKGFKDDLVTCFEYLEHICKHLSQAFSNFSKGASIGFKNGSNYKWDQFRKEIVKNLSDVSWRLEIKRVIAFFEPFDVKEVLKTLNKVLEKFSDDQVMIKLDLNALHEL